MKYLFWTIAFISTAIWIYFVVSNLSSTSGITLLDNTPANILGTNPIKLTVNSGLIISLFFILGSLTSFSFIKPFLLKYREKEGAFERKLEKTSVSSDANSAKVKVLEAKIQTLEKALENALKNK